MNMPEKQKNKTSLITKAYIFSALAFFIPGWLASALMDESLGPDNITPRFIIILTLLSLICWSPSVGLFMMNKKWYAFLSGLGRLIVICACIFIDSITLNEIPEGGHPYVSFLGILAAFVWGAIDLVLIYTTGKKNSTKNNIE